MRIDNNTKAFLALLSAGLCEKDVTLSQYGVIDYNKIYQLAEEQSVVGLVASGLEHIIDVKVPQDVTFQFVGQTIQIEQRNIAMNGFINTIIEKMRNANIYTLLIKGQGIAQCYERPLWRTCGDIDFFLNESNYDASKKILVPLASYLEKEYAAEKHLAMTIDCFVVELHGTLRCGLSSRIDKVLDELARSILNEDKIRPWLNGNTQIYLLAPDEDVVFVFSHILQHFFLGGIGLRQLCDLARLLWTYKDDINRDLLYGRLTKMGLMTEWKAFGCVLVDVLGLDEKAMPFYDKSYLGKIKKILTYILKVGNFGHNKDNSYQSMDNTIIRKLKTFFRQAGESIEIMQIFPRNAIVSLLNYWVIGTKEIVNCEKRV